MAESAGDDIIENPKSPCTLPPFSFFIAFPLEIKGDPGSPVHAVALVPKEGQ